MKIDEIIETYMSRKGLCYISCRGKDDVAPLLPLLIMDCALDTFNSYIPSKKECKHKLKFWRNEWMSNYTKFNGDFFNPLNEDQTCFLTDLMDEFGDYIYKYKEVAFYQFMNLLKNEPVERRKVLSACMMISIYCQTAQIMWGNTYKKSADIEDINPLLDLCEKNINAFKDLYYGKSKNDVNPNNCKPLMDAVDSLCHHIVDFLYKYL